MHENQNTELTTVLVLSTFIYHNDLYLCFFFFLYNLIAHIRMYLSEYKGNSRVFLKLLKKIPVMIKMNRHYFFHQEKARFCFGLLLQFQIVIAK